MPALVRALGEQERLELALVDDLQQSDLSPSETALAMARLVELGMSQKQIAKRIGRSAGYVRERLKLLELPCRRPLPRRRRNGLSVAAVQDSR